MTETLHAQLQARAALIARLQRCVVKALRLDLDPTDIDPNTALFGAGLGLDSIDTLELVLEIEDAFKIDGALIDADQYTLRNLNTLADLLERQAR